eukprot:761892-Hanusia_phi.AAC.3
MITGTGEAGALNFSLRHKRNCMLNCGALDHRGDDGPDHLRVAARQRWGRQQGRDETGSFLMRLRSDGMKFPKRFRIPKTSICSNTTQHRLQLRASNKTELAAITITPSRARPRKTK